METGIIILAFALVLSVTINIILYNYTRDVVRKLTIASELASQIFTRLDAYRSHLESIFQMSIFYGDETIEGLIKHTKEVRDFLKNFEEVYSFTQPDLDKILEQIEYDDTETDEEEAQEEEV